MVIRIENMDIEVSSIERAAYYIDLVKKANVELTRFFTQQKIIDPKNPTQINVVKSLLQNLASQLDNEIVDFIDRDLEVYIENKIKKEKTSTTFPKYKSRRDYYDQLDRENALAEYKIYLKSNEKTFAEKLKNKYPKIMESLRTITDNYIQNTKSIFSRLKKDKKMLEQYFLQDLENPVLRKIISTGSDFHKHGQQVLILEYIGSNGKTKKIVYKPSPITADAMIVGDVAQLASINSEFANQKSFVEIINELIDKSYPPEVAEHKKLPNYLIVPCRDTDTDDLNQQYGYIEYLSHEPGEPNYEEVIKKAVEAMDPRDIKATDFQPIFDEAYKKHLMNASSKSNCDFIAMSEKEIKIFSDNCGEWIAIMAILGISDNHLENVRTRERKPVLIDCEVCLSVQKSPTPRASSALDPKNGSMNAKSKKPEDYDFLLDVNGKKTIRIFRTSANILYKIDENNEIVPCQPNKDDILAGYHDTLELMANNASVILDWFQQDKVKNMYVRFIPQSTGDFVEELKAIKKADFSENEYENYCLIKLDSQKIGINTYHNDVTQYNNTLTKKIDTSDPAEEYVAHELPPFPVPNSVVFTDTNPSKNIFSEYKTSSVPVYYLRANDLKLYDFNGKPIEIPSNFKIIRNSIDKTVVPKLTPEERYYVHKENKIVDGVDFHIMSELPEKKDAYKGSYVWVKKIPLDDSELFYINEKAQAEEVRLFEMEVFAKIVADYMQDHQSKRLTIPQIISLVNKTNSNHCLFVRLRKLPRLTDTDNEFIPKTPLQITYERATKILKDKQLTQKLEELAGLQVISLQPIDESLIREELALRQLKAAIAKLKIDHKMEIDIKFDPDLKQLIISSLSFPWMEFEALSHALIQIGLTVQVKYAGLSLSLLPQSNLIINMPNPDIILRVDFDEQLKNSFEYSLALVQNKISLEQIEHYINKLNLNLNLEIKNADSDDISQPSLYIKGHDSLEFKAVAKSLAVNGIQYQMQQKNDELELVINRPNADTSLSFEFARDFEKHYQEQLDILRHTEPPTAKIPY